MRNPMTSLGERLHGPSGDRGQPGNGMAKTVRSRLDALTTIQAMRGDVDAERDGRAGGRGAPWSVAVVHDNRADRYTPKAARDFAALLMAAAHECEQWASEDAR